MGRIIGAESWERNHGRENPWERVHRTGFMGEHLGGRSLDAFRSSGKHLGSIHLRFSPLVCTTSWDCLPILDGCGTPFDIFELTFDALGESLGPPWDTLGSRPLKTSKKSLFGTSFLRHFGMTCLLFLRMCFQCVFNTFADQIFHEFGTILEPLLNYMSPLS